MHVKKITEYKRLVLLLKVFNCMIPITVSEMAEFFSESMSSLSIQDLPEDEKRVVIHRQPSHANKVLSNLQEMRRNAELTDVVLCASGREFPCHKAILSASSQYFRAMFTSDLRERNSSKVNLREIDSKSLSYILDYVYSGEVKISLENAQSLFQAADFLDYNNLSAGCIVFLKSNITVQNCIELIRFACQCTVSNSLITAAMTFLDRHFESVVKSQSFLELEPDMLLRILYSESIKLTKEEDVLLACIKWLEHDMAYRDKYIRDLLRVVRLPLVRETVLQRLRANSSIVKQSSFMQDAFNEAIYCHILSQSGYRVLGVQTRPRAVPPGQSSQMMIVVGGQYLSDDGDIKCSSDVACTYLQSESSNGIATSSWTPLAPMPDYKKRKFCVTAVGSNLFVTGGFDIIQNRSSRAVWCFSYNRNSWYPVSSMIHCRHSHASEEFFGKVAVVGGKSSFIENRLSSFELYDIGSNSWAEMEPMPVAVSVPSITNIDQKLYVIGGSTKDGSPCPKIQVFNHSLHLWTMIDMANIIRRKTLRAIATGKKILMIGSRKPRDALMFDVITEQDANIRQPSKQRLFPGITSCNRKIWLVGGRSDSDDVLDSAEVYDSSVDRWNTVTGFLPRGLFLQGCVTINDKP